MHLTSICYKCNHHQPFNIDFQWPADPHHDLDHHGHHCDCDADVDADGDVADGDGHRQHGDAHVDHERHDVDGHRHNDQQHGHAARRFFGGGWCVGMWRMLRMSIFLNMFYNMFKFKQFETTIYNGGFVVKKLMRNMLM